MERIWYCNADRYYFVVVDDVKSLKFQSDRLFGYRTITGGSNNKVQFIVLVHKYVGVNALTWLNLQIYYCYDALSQSYRSLLLLKRALLLLTRTFLSSI